MIRSVTDGLQTLALLRRAHSSSHWPAERIRQTQAAALRRLIQHAYERVPLYRQLYDEAGFDPRAFRGLDDLEQVPVLTTERLKAAAPGEVVSRGVDPSRCQTVATSGSTGTPLRIHLGPAEVRWQRATAWRILLEHGFRFSDRTLEIRKTFGNRFAVQRLGIAAKDWLSILDPPQQWARCLMERRHRIVVAAAGTLVALAEAIEELGMSPPTPRLVVADSETLTASARQRIARALGTEPIDVYGLVELSNFAWECEQRSGFHVSADSHIVEVIPRPDGHGRLVATGLGMWTQPIIRYETGDCAELVSAHCACGRSLPRLGRILGRAVDSVRLPDGRRLFWPFFHEILGAHSELGRWRIVQDTPDALRVELVLPPAAVDALTRIEAELRRALPDAMTLDIVRRNEIEVAPDEKTRMIVCRC